MSDIDKKDLLQHLLDFLHFHGYPDDSLLIDYKIGNNRADVVVADVQNHTLLQIFILKTEKNETKYNSGKLQMNNFMHETSKTNPDISGYLIFPADKQPFFEAINPLNNKQVSSAVFDYNNLVQKGKNANENMLNKNKNRAVGNLKWATLVLVGLTVAVLILDFLNIIEVTGYRLYLILMIIILILLPYFETIKIASFELTQKQKDKK